MGLSARVGGLQASPIREILSVIDRPGMISFAGGLPAAESFQVPDFSGFPAAWLQYGPSEGEPALREAIRERLAYIGLHCETSSILVLSGSQQGIDLAAKLFVDPGTPVAVESPTYLAALQVLRFFGARFLPLGEEAGELAALAYAVPTFQNPTGRCYSLEERRSLAADCDARGIPLFEDDPYRDLAYGSCDRTPVCSLLKKASWIYQGSFSKTLAPGLRLGFLASSPDLAPALLRLKQAADLHSCRLSQWLVLRHLQSPCRGEALEALRSFYRCRRDRFEALMREHLGELADWDCPAGGLFFWLRLRGAVDSAALLSRSIAENVAFMPGEPFFPATPPGSCLRLNFSHADEDQARRGLKILARLLREAREAA